MISQIENLIANQTLTFKSAKANISGWNLSWVLFMSKGHLTNTRGKIEMG